MGEIKKRSQVERIKMALGIIEDIWAEMLQGKKEQILQNAVYVQAAINRIVWRLNTDMEGDDAEDNY